ncbi:MAG: PQQ-binding-like beta-propeller repeat protein [Pseudomonadota bacterium]
MLAKRSNIVWVRLKVNQLLILSFLVLCSGVWGAERHPGQRVYETYCAACHDNPEEAQARSLNTLRRMIPALVEHALRDGRMSAQGSVLSDEQIRDVVNYVAGAVQGTDDWELALRCDADRQEADIHGEVYASTFGLGHKNHRAMSAEQAGLKTTDLVNLELAWSLGFPNVTMMRSQPVMVGDTLFVSPVETQKVFAFDISGTPCLQWTYQSDRVLRSSLTFGYLENGQSVLTFGDTQAAVHMVDAATGNLLWVTSLRRFPESIITGTPQIYDGRVFASISQFEIMLGAQPTHLCCKSRGAVAALDAQSGEIIWFTPTLPDARPQRDRGDGQMIWGPSGAPVWTSPAIDEKRGLLYVGTGESTSEPAHHQTDAILAIRLNDGEVVWSFQATEQDIFLAGCWRSRSLNCPPEYSVERDVDFGASVIIAQRADGSDILLAGQKSSVVWGLDPEREGQVVWRWSYGTGTANGGIHWAMAYDGETVFAPINDPGRPRPGFQPVPGIYALDVNNGALRWGHTTEPECDGREERAPRCSYLHGFSAAPLLVDRGVVTGSLDGMLRIFDADTGDMLFKYDTNRAYATANGVTGHGGAIDSAAFVAGNGLLLVNSGYGMFGQPQGNVLLAFKVKRD